MQSRNPCKSNDSDHTRHSGLQIMGLLPLDPSPLTHLIRVIPQSVQINDSNYG